MRPLLCSVHLPKYTYVTKILRSTNRNKQAQQLIYLRSLQKKIQNISMNVSMQCSKKLPSIQLLNSERDYGEKNYSINKVL